MDNQNPKSNQQPTQPVDNQNQTNNGQYDAKADVEKNKTMAILAYFIFFLPLVTDAKDSKFAKFHANQGLILLIFAIAGPIILAFIPILGWMLASIWGLPTLIFGIMGIVNANNGEMKEMPLIGGIHILDK